MKLSVGFSLLFLASLSSADIPVTVYDSLEQFKETHPGVELIEMDAYDHQVDASRSYSVGARQTGKIQIKILKKPSKFPSPRRYRRCKCQQQEKLANLPERHYNSDLPELWWEWCLPDLHPHQL